MKGSTKLRLSLEALEVDTFDVLSEAAEPARGTVAARATGFRGSACTDCGECGGQNPEDETPVVESMMEFDTCGGQFSCNYGWCGETLDCPSYAIQPTGCTDACWTQCAG